MRLVNVTVLGSALVAAGMLAPGAGTDEATGQHGVIAVDPEVVRPGQRVKISVPGCVGGEAEVTSQAFARTATDGAATVKRDVEHGTYTVAALCGSRKVSGEFDVAGRLSWPTLLPTDH
ncbi:hypothetical protein [Actinomadura sp. 7K507]|uniref:hypothetical protein n=1 Tax=Actinomadura sp. 7K507 TaxID=2530365 RepID=UPI00104CB968|nr:hypothetical protein [Actinomadura sp. 7K507]TDC92217.1 hypothetical protein E1285_11890 [Actinomadura sp. 7K507]